MLRVGTQIFCLFFATLSLGTATSTAQAYLDPGTGSMILQIMLGGVAGVALAGACVCHGTCGQRRGTRHLRFHFGVFPQPLDEIWRTKGQIVASHEFFLDDL